MGISDVNVFFKECRSLEKAFSDLLTKYASRPSAELARMIEHARAELADRRRPT
jgi:hypothetical protein